MVVTPYETFSLRNMSYAKTEEKLKNLYITNRLLPFDRIEEDNNFVVLGLFGDQEDIPVFYQPFTVFLPQKKTAIVVDVRPYQRFLRVEGDKIYFIQPNEQVNQLIFNAIFNGIWRDDPVQVVSFNDVPMQVYGSLFADNLSKRLGLDAATTLNIMATMQIFYTTRAHRDITQLDDAERQAICMSLSRKMKVDLNTHKVIMDRMEPEDLDNLSTICQFIARQGWSTRLNNLSVKDIYNILMTGWVGQGNPKETMMVALEFPPTFLSLVYLCARNNFYQKLPIGQIVKRLDRGNNLKNLEVNIMNMLVLTYNKGGHMAVYLPDGKSYTPDDYRDFLVRHASKTIWCSPFEDERFILHLSRLTKSGGDISTSIIFKNCTKLPTSDAFYHLYMVGGNHPFDFHFPKVQGQWISMTEWCNEATMNFKMYNDKGIVIPLDAIFYYREYDGNIIFAVKHDFDRFKHLDIDKDNIYIDFRVSQFWTEDTNVKLEYRTLTKSDKFGTVKDRDNIASYVSRNYKRHNRNPVDRDFNSMYVSANMYQNGLPVFNFDKAERGDYLDYVEDGTISETHLFRVSELPFFQSTLDKKNKYAVVLTNRSQYGIYRNMMETVYRDDIEIHLVKIDPKTVAMPANSNSYTNINQLISTPKAVFETGCYYHINDEDSIRMLSHRAFSLPVDRVHEFIRALDDNINLDNWYIYLRVKLSGLVRELIPNSHEMQSWFTLPYATRVAALTSSPAPVEAWHAANLEESSYNYLLRCYLHEITPERVIDAYGYSHTARAMMNPNVMITKDPNIDYFIVPTGLTSNSTVYEYNEEGRLLGWYHHLSSTRYLPVNKDCVYIEMIPGLGQNNPRWVQGYGTQTFSKKEITGYRAYIMDGLRGTITDVTSDSSIVFEDEENITVNAKDEDYVTVIRDDTFISVTRTLNGKSDGVFDFYLSSTNLKYMQIIPCENVAVWIDGYSLVEGIDYIVEFPKVTIISRKFLEHIEQDSEDTVELTYRCLGYVHPDFKRRSTRETGFVIDGKLSYDNTVDEHLGRNLRVVVGGSTINPDTLTTIGSFKEIEIGEKYEGMPYQIIEHIFPLTGVMSTNESLELYKKEIETQEQIREYATSQGLLDIRHWGTRINSTVIKEHYHLYSPFMSSIVNDILRDQEKYLDIDYKDKMELEDLVSKYKTLLPSDPAYIGHDIDYAVVHPMPFKFTDKIIIHHRIMSLLEHIAKTYLKSPVALSSWFKVKRTRKGE